MLGWSRRWLFSSPPFFLPQGIYAPGRPLDHGAWRYAPPLVCLLVCFVLATGARMLEFPFWDNPSYRLGEEFLLATHDAYHWIAGAEGFEFGAGHPMAELARVLALWTDSSPALVGFWLPPFMSGLLAVAVFLWGWGLGRPYAGLAAGVLASLSPAFFARTLLGFYDTDLIILLFAVLLGLIPALWISPWLASLPEVLFAPLFRRYHGRERAEPPHVQARQDIFAPWFFGNKARQPGSLLYTRAELERSMLTWPWLVLLVLSGMFGHTMQGWHSLFPYLVRYSALVPPLVVLIAGPRGGRSTLLAGSLCHALPLLMGWPGAVAGLVYACALMFTRHSPADSYDPPAAPELAHAAGPPPWLSLCWRLYPPSREFQRSLARGWPSLALLWGLVVFLAFDMQVFEAMLRSFFAYVERGGDMASSSTPALDPVVFPSVAQSIIEIQTISLHDLLAYIYPVEAVTLICLAIFAARLFITPVFVWFAPLLVLCLLSLKMGARMTLFGPPMLMLALCMEGGLVLEVILRGVKKMLQAKSSGTDAAKAPLPAPEPDSGPEPEKAPRQAAAGFRGKLLATRDCAAGLALCLICTFVLARPLVMLLPDYTQGPVLSHEQAEGLSFLKEYSPGDSLIWNWWDWGYATHHFARRETIADGARHGGPSLYLPAAVYTTADPRFARQIIKHTAAKGNVPGNIFTGLSGAQAQQLMRDLGNPALPLINAPGRQYLVASFELLRLGLWVTRYGSWNFETKESSGSLMNNLASGLTFNMDTGIILTNSGEPVYAASIALIETRLLERMNYNRYGAYHFIFSTQYLQYDNDPDPLRDFMRDIWKTLRPDFSLPGQISDKLVMDEVFYNTMMVQLLLCPPDDPAIAPYFKLVFDNKYTRIFEVQ